MCKRVILAAVLSAVALGLQACFYRSSPPAQYGQYGQYQPSHTICDVNGNNCLACDANNTNCRRVDAQYGSSRTVCDAHGCVVCDANNANCQGTPKSSWGFFF